MAKLNVSPIFGLGLLLIQAVHCNYYASADFYAKPLCSDGRGWGVNDFCYYFPSFRDMYGARLTGGSCVKLYKDNEDSVCTLESYTLSYPDIAVCSLPFGIAKTVSQCDIQGSNVRCPLGSYVREIEYGSPTEGFTVHCYSPSEDVPTLSWNSHGRSIGQPSKSSCPVAAVGYSARYDANWEMFTGLEVACSPGNLPKTNSGVGPPPSKLPLRKVMSADMNMTSSGNANQRVADLCPANQAMTGVHTIIEEGGVIKDVGYYCEEVVDRTTICEPLESLSLIVQCDNTASGNELQCSYSQTVGVGESRTMSSSERKEMQFSQEMGFGIEASIFGLKASMSTKLGFSQLVGYEWSESDTRTWTTETTVTATINVRPYTESKLEQLIGKCSFYGTSVNFFKQTDINSTGVAAVRYFRV